VIPETDGPTTSQINDTDPSGTGDTERHEPDLQVYSDALLLTDALGHHDVADLTDQDTDVLVNLYILLSDVQRSANDLRQDIANVLLDRLHHDQPVSDQYESVRKAEVNEDTKETRLQGLKDRLVASDEGDEEAQELQE
jgi:hypothetical protein